MVRRCCVCFFFFNDTATTEIYTLSLHDALPIFTHRYSANSFKLHRLPTPRPGQVLGLVGTNGIDRKSTRLNSSHSQISYAVFCLKKKTSTMQPLPHHPITPPRVSHTNRRARAHP